jgi:hypothetical protein
MALIMGTVLLAAVTLAAPAQASEGIDSFESTMIENNTATPETPRAGEHPDLEASFSLHNPGSPESAQNVTFEAPQGVFGNTNAISQCSAAAFTLDQCPTNSQAGLITVYAKYESNPHYLLGTAPLYDMVPQAEETARFSFVAPTIGVPISIPVTVRTNSDYGLTFTVSDITQVTPLAGANLIFWGFPAAANHDAERFPKGSPGEPAGCPGLADASCTGGAKATIPAKPLTDNPTECTGEALPTTLRVQTYQDPGHVSVAHSSYPAMTECENETFTPVLDASATTTETDAPSGLNLELSTPQFEGLAASPTQIKSAVLTLPPGFTVNPDAADGQTECTEAEANFESEGPAECPDNSKIGTFAISSPSLNGLLIGSVYIGEPKPGDQYRLFMIASGFGINAKLKGSMKPDPATGQVVAYFENLPQVPFETFEMHLFAGERSLLATPTACTTYAITADFFPWNTSRADQTSPDTFELESGPHGSPCPGQVRPFSPTLEAGTSTPVAGSYSSFALKLSREDGDQFLGKLNFILPPGLTGNLSGITYCPEAAITAAASTPGRAEQASPSCPASSEIGTTNVAAGPGSHPFHAVGKMYLAGPFKGAPLSLVAVTPAIAGPYDYGTVVVRVAINVDPLDAHVSADSETVPEIIGGVPIRMRSIEVDIDKPNFMINPTNCSPFSVASEGIGDQGTVAKFSSYIHAVDCGTLPFKPNMKIRQLGGPKKTVRSADPALHFDLTTRPGDANVRSVAVTLSKAFAIDQRHLGNICSKAQLAAERCAGRQPIGRVSTHTPLLDAPLSGLAYAVSGFGGLPHVVFILGGQVTLMPEGESSSVNGGHLKTTVPLVPDAPIGHFRLNLFGGKQGYIVNTRSLCASPDVATVEYTGQNGKKSSQQVKTKTACGKSSPRHGRHRR